jgi:ABC-type branched-subunit amino acid transport system ATPase component
LHLLADRRARPEDGGLSANGHHPPAPRAILQVHDLDVDRGRVQVLFGVDLDVVEGQTLALLGTNGAGKSTLLKAIAGILPVARGSITFDGRDITAATTASRVEAGIVQVAGGEAVFPTMSVADNLRAGAFLFLDDKERVARKTAEVLALFPKLADLLKQPAGSLSGGEQQMLAVAKALLLEPRLLVIDELSLGLAPIVVELLLGVIERRRSDGLTMLIVEQSINVAGALADQAVFMERGEVRFRGAMRDLVDDGDLVRAVFLGGQTFGAGQN